MDGSCRPCCSATTTRSSGGYGPHVWPTRPRRKFGAGGATEMTQVPDFKAMTQDELAAWFMNNDASALFASGERTHDTAVQVDAEGQPVNQLVSLRIPSDVVARIDAVA